MAPHTTNDRAIPGTIAVFALVLALTIGVSIRISTLQPPFGTLVFGSHVLWRAHTASFRIATMDAQQEAMLPQPHAVVRLRDHRGVRSEAAAVGERFATVLLAVPADIDAYPWLEVVATRPEGIEVVTVPVHVADVPGPLDGVLVDAPALTHANGSVSVQLYPNNGHVVGGLDNEVRGRLTRQGVPWQTHVRVPGAGIAGIAGIDTASDAAGLFTWHYRPLPGAGLQLQLGDQGAITMPLSLDVQATQLLLRTEPMAWLAPGTALTARLDALPFRDPVLLDLWVGNTLLLGLAGQLTGGHGRVALSVPSDWQGLVAVTAYRSLLAPQDNASTHVVWAGTLAEAPMAARHALAAVPGSAAVLAVVDASPADARVPLLELALSRVVPRAAGAPLLVSTVVARRLAFDQERDAMRQTLHLFFASTMLGGLALATGWAVTHQRRLRRNFGAVMHAGVAAGEDLDPAVGVVAARLARVSNVMNLVCIIAALILAGYGVLALLARMRWA